ncbi:MAG: DUF881 domain-containing protein [Ornithinimicrobium sp.]
MTPASDVPPTDGSAADEPSTTSGMPPPSDHHHRRRFVRSTERTRGAAWRRLGRISGPRLSRGNLLAAGITLLLGVALVAQVQSTQAGDLTDLPEDDLIALLDDVTGRADSLQQEVQQLERDRARLAGGEDEVAAAQAAQSRLDSYQILAGTVAVSGPGIEVLVRDPDRELTTTAIIDMIQELRDGGAEAIQIGDVRVVASTWVEARRDTLTVDGTTVDEPYRVLAIGDSHTLAGALAIPGGFTDNVRRNGGTVDVEESADITVDALHSPTTPTYAQPVP